MVDSIGAKPTIAIDRTVTPVAATQAVKAVAAAAKDTGDTATVSVTALARQLAQTPPVDAERIARIRKAVADGTFPIAPAKIADRLIALKFEWKSR